MRRRKARKKEFPQWTYDTQLNQVGFDGLELSVKAFSCACGGKYVNEIEGFLCSVRAYHDDPIYFITDDDGKEEIERASNQYNFQEIYILKVIDDNYVNEVKKKTKNVKEHLKYWSMVWIYAKLECFKLAILEENKKNPANGVLALDGDIILNSRIDEKWDADLVFSPHSISTPIKHGWTVYGFYNAGFALSNRKAIANHWIAAFLRGGEQFYEQTAMEELSRKWVTDVFSENHNFGKWRRENLSASKRKVRSFHLHFGEGVIYSEQPEFHRQAKAALDRNIVTCRNNSILSYLKVV